MWRIQLFGGVVVSNSSVELKSFITQKNAALLAYLAIYSSHPHSREEVAGIFWPDSSTQTSRHSLRMALCSLRKLFQIHEVNQHNLIVTDQNTISINSLHLYVDVCEFDELLDNISKNNVSIASLNDALSIYRGDLMPGYYHDFLLLERRRLTERYLEHTICLIRLYEREGDIVHALEWTFRGLKIDPTNEDLCHLLIHLLLSSGKKTTAIRCYQEMEARFLKELGMAPPIHLKELLTQHTYTSLLQSVMV